MWLPLLILVLFATFNASAANRIEEQIDSLRKGTYALSGEALPDCKIQIYPNYVQCGPDQAGAWYLLLDGAGLFIERAVFAVDSETVLCERTASPCLCLYEYRDLAGREATWTIIGDSLFDKLAASKNVTIRIDQGEKKLREIKFTAKARASLGAFRDSVRARLATERFAPAALQPSLAPCESFDLSKTDASLSLVDAGFFTVRKPKSDHWKLSGDATAAMILYEKKHEEMAENLTGRKLGFSRIRIFPIDAEQSQWEMTEEQVADEYFASQEASMLSDGAYKHVYDLAIVAKKSECRGQNRMFYFAWHVVHPNIPGGNLNVLYLCFPPDFHTSHRFVAMLFSGAASKVIETRVLSDRYTAEVRPGGETVFLDLLDFFNLLNSFRFKS